MTFATLALVAVTASVSVGLTVAAIRYGRLSVSTDAPVVNVFRHHERSGLPESLQWADVETLLGSLSLGIAIMKGPTVVYANDLTRRALAAEPDVALLGGLIRSHSDRAAKDGPQRRTVELFGPPPASYFLEASVFERAVPTSDAGPPLVLIIVSDITDLVRTEAVRRDFVANISHELRTPIGAITLLAETMESADDPAVAARFASRISSEIDRLRMTVDDLLELAQIEFGGVDQTVKVALGPLVEDVALRLKSAAELQGVTLRVDSSSHTEVGGSVRQLTSAVFNLVDNAIKYTERGGEVSIGVSMFVDEHGRSFGQIEVKDTGIGIPRGDLDRIFERFFRVDRARSRGTGGTGLGLAIVRHIVAAHGGLVAAESTEGRGSCFTVRIPAAPAAPEGDLT